MFDLRQLGPRTYAIEAPVNLGIFLLEENRVLLIDSGLDSDTGKRVLRILDAQGWTLSHLLNTHAHADHAGGNALLSARTGCAILATAEEAPIIEQPWLEPAMLYGGCPPTALRNKHTMAKPSVVAHRLPEGLPEGLALLPLPGHTPGMVGVRTADDVLFLADSLLSEATLAKHPIFFLWDVEAQQKTLHLLEAQRAAWFVPCHADICQDILPMIRANRQAMRAIIAALMEAARDKIAEEPLLRRVTRGFAIADNALQHALAGCTLRSYLSYLLDAGLMDVRYAEGLRLFRAVPELPDAGSSDT